MEIKNFQKQLIHVINSLEEKIKENIFLSTEKNSYLSNYLLNEQNKFQEETIESLININYINNCLKQERFSSITERNKFLENQIFPIKKNTYWFYNQGLKKTTSWKGKTILKTAYDLIIYQMLLWELKPKTIVEIGTGNGSSSEYLNDLNEIYKNRCKIFTFDINNKNTIANNINYLNIDLNDNKSFDKYLNIFQNLEKPTLIIEDAHVNVDYVIKYFSKFLISGDYFIIEDSISETDSIINKYPIIEDICKNENFLIDTKFTDYFGTNMTSSKNSILKKN
jgi:cephalosporin hydroxylase